jgi:hypothetical protein
MLDMGLPSRPLVPRAHRGPYSAVAAVEHAPVPAFKADPGQAQDQQPTVTVVVRALRPGDGPLAGERVLRDYDQQGWKLHFFSNNTPIQAFPDQPLEE